MQEQVLLKISNRRKAAKKFVMIQYGVTYVNIVRGKTVIAEYVKEVHADRLIEGYNLLNEQEIEQENKQRKLENKPCQALMIVKEKPIIAKPPTVKAVIAKRVKRKPKTGNIEMFGFTIVKDIN